MGRTEFVFTVAFITGARTADAVKGKEKPAHKWQPRIIPAGTELAGENKGLFLQGSSTGANHKQPSVIGGVVLETEGSTAREGSFLLTALLESTGLQAQKDGVGAPSSSKHCTARLEPWLRPCRRGMAL